jgi:hypothetical protein
MTYRRLQGLKFGAYDSSTGNETINGDIYFEKFRKPNATSEKMRAKINKFRSPPFANESEGKKTKQCIQ